ncbi:phage tail fiber domain-containing protein, partial [Propionispora hippei]
MASERKTIVTYKGTGSQKVFAFPFDYLRKSFIKVMIDGNPLTYGTDYTVSDKQLTFTNAPVLNAIIVIYRETATDRLVAWEDASVLRAGDLTLFEVQLLHIAEETKDKVQEAGLALDDLDGKWDARLKVLKNLLDPVDNLDAVNKRYFESTQAGYIQASQAKVDQATAQANFAQSKANDASASASAARTSELNAKASETAAKTSETNAKAS